MQGSYIASLQHRKVCDVPTYSKPCPQDFVIQFLTFALVVDTLLASLNQLVDSLTGLERILTTPIPFSYVQNN